MAISTTIPESFKLPLFFATVDGSKAGNLTENLPALLPGQYNASGSLATTSSTASSSPILHFGAGNVPAWVTPGMTIVDVTSGAAIAAAQTVLSINFSTGDVTMSANASATVGSGDVMTFAAPSNPGSPSVAVNVPYPIGSVAQARALYGRGSMLARMIEAFFAVNTTQLLYALPVPDPAAGVKALGNIAIISPPTASGVLTVYIAGQSVAITVQSTDTAATIATNLTAQITAQPDLPVTAAVDGTNAYQVNVTCRWFGATGNDITLFPNFRGASNGEALPAGVTLKITAMASGASAPNFTAAISAIQMQEFDFVGMPYADVASEAVWATEYGFGATGRWNFTRQQYGMIFNSYRNDYSDAITRGLSTNAPVISSMVIEQDVASPVWEVAAAYCGLGALAFSDDPARPLQTLELVGILPARLQNRFTQAQQNNLTNSGFAVQGVDPNGNMMILREATQYQLNSFGQGDTAFGLLTILATLAELLRRMKSAITSKYPRVKLVPDGTKLGPGQAAVTPGDIKAELIAEFVAAEFDGLVADLPDFKDNLIVEIDDNNPNRVNVLWPPQLAGQLRQFAALAQFRLQYPPVAT